MSNKSPSLPMCEGKAMRSSQSRIVSSISWKPRVAWVKAGYKSFLVKNRDHVDLPARAKEKKMRKFAWITGEQPMGKGAKKVWFQWASAGQTKGILQYDREGTLASLVIP